MSESNGSAVKGDEEAGKSLGELKNSKASISSNGPQKSCNRVVNMKAHR